MKKIFIILILIITVKIGEATPIKFNLKGTVLNNQNETIQRATIEIISADGKDNRYIITDESGNFNMSLIVGEYKIIISYVGFKTQSMTKLLNKDENIVIKLKKSHLVVEDIVVTASEKRGLTASSIINKKAMEHLQPSSFSDILELLPGGMSSDPILNKVNSIRLRQAGSGGSNYDISSLGTAFIVDGIPLSGDANMQSIRSGVQVNDNRDITSKGIDMRSISTDNIESVEIIRGIPSVMYGDLTSGVVKISRKEGATKMQTRFKADQFSKLIYAGKGFGVGEKGNTNINISADYLNSKSDPRDSYETYKRITTSAKLVSKKYYTDSRLEYRSSLDYSGSFDNKKFDPDIDERNDEFSSSFNKMSIGNSIKYMSEKESILRSIELKTSFSMQFDKLQQTKDIYLQSPSTAPNSTEEGEHEGVFLPNKYLSHLTIDGKPINGFVSLNSNIGFDKLGLSHRMNIGMDYRIDKNIGEGQLYDATRPPSAKMRGRPRAYNDIPAIQKISFYVEDKISHQFDKNKLTLLAGVRSSTMIGMDERYNLNNKIYLDPRVNIQWKRSNISIFGYNSEISFGGGYGVHTKMPTLAHLYPEKNYYDYESLNYYHNNSDYRKLYLTTFIIDPTNYNLDAAVNRKWEVRGDISINGNHLSVTYFREKMNSGFRPMLSYRATEYKKYDTSGIDHSSITASPNPNDLPYNSEKTLTTYSQTENGSSLHKEGIEFQFSSKRIRTINTRVTINGAYFKTTYSNSGSMLYDSNVVVNGKKLQYIGIYDLKDGSIKEQFNTNIMLDTYISKLGLTFSTSLQCMFFTNSSTLPKNRVPYAYIDVNGDVHAYKDSDKTDYELQWLVLDENSTINTRVPIAAMVNFKANKHFGENINISLFVNKIIDYLPDYEIHNNTIRRSVSPYFGMEMNLKF